MLKERSFFMEEAKRIVKLAQEKEIPLRVMGACAIAIHSGQYENSLYDKLNRQLSDLDFMTTAGRDKTKAFFTELGYIPRDRFLAIMEEVRHIYDNEQTGLTADVFFNELSMCHKIDFRDRLLIDYLTISPADILLEKLQIVKISTKDVVDLVILLIGHDVGGDDRDKINSKYVAHLLSDDWGFYYTVTTNLTKIRDQFLSGFSGLTEYDRDIVKPRIDNLLTALEQEPKSFKWKMRAKLGPKKIWYQEVEEVER